MPSITLRCPYKQNELVMSPEEMLETYFYGIKIESEDGKRISQDMLKFYLQSATEEVEKHLSIKLIPQVIDEDKDFWLNDWQQWGYVRLAYPVKKAFLLEGFINDIRQITYPAEWVSIRRSNDGINLRNIYLVPTNGTATSNSVVFNGISPHLGFMGMSHIPNYWRAKYCTGFDKMPKDLLNFIGKLASINVFNVLGDLILGAGIASTSIGIDGLSQSISSTSSATMSGYGARMTAYTEDLKLALPKIVGYYKGFEMTSM